MAREAWMSPKRWEMEMSSAAEYEVFPQQQSMMLELHDAESIKQQYLFPETCKDSQFRSLFVRECSGKYVMGVR